MKLRFPWRLYHGPIVRAFAAVLEGFPAARVLNLGAGPFFELDVLPRGARTFVACDIDPRAVRLARQIHGARLSGADQVDPEAPLPYADGAFDVVAAMDVVEHVAPPEPWLQEAWRVVAPGGVLFVTTPNYGSMSLRLLELTALELVARAQGFSRRQIHPSKFDEPRLAAALRALPGGHAAIERVAFGWVLSARVRRGASPSRANPSGSQRMEHAKHAMKNEK